MLILDNNEYNQFIGEIYISNFSKKYYTKFDTTSSKSIIYDAFD
jgi:cytoskeletal protein RodZ